MSDLPNPINAAEAASQPNDSIKVPTIKVAQSNEKPTPSTESEAIGSIQRGQATLDAQNQLTSPAAVHAGPTTQATSGPSNGEQPIDAGYIQVQPSAYDTGTTQPTDTQPPAGTNSAPLGSLIAGSPNYAETPSVQQLSSALNGSYQQGQQLTLPQVDALGKQRALQGIDSLANSAAVQHPDDQRNLQFYPQLYQGDSADAAFRSITETQRRNQGIIDQYATNQAQAALVAAQQTPPQNRTDPNQYHPNSTANPFEQAMQWLGIGGEHNAPFNPLNGQFGQAGHGVGGGIMYALGLIQNVPVGILGDLKNARDRAVNALGNVPIVGTPLQSILNWNPVTNIFQPFAKSSIGVGLVRDLHNAADTTSNSNNPFIRAIGAGENAIAAIPNFLANANLIHNTDGDKTKPLHLVQALRGAQWSGSYEDKDRLATDSPIGLGTSEKDARVPWYLDPGHIAGIGLDLLAVPKAGAGLVSGLNSFAKVTSATKVARVTAGAAKVAEVLENPIGEGFKLIKGGADKVLRVPGVPEKPILPSAGARVAEDGTFVATGSGDAYKMGDKVQRTIITPPPPYDARVGSRLYKDGTFTYDAPKVEPGKIQPINSETFKTQNAIEKQRIQDLLKKYDLVPASEVQAPKPIEVKPDISLVDAGDAVIQPSTRQPEIPVVNIRSLEEVPPTRMASKELPLLKVVSDEGVLKPTLGDGSALVEPALVEKGEVLQSLRDSLEEQRQSHPLEYFPNDDNEVLPDSNTLLGEDLGQLFQKADSIGNKYQTVEEIAQHQEQLGKEAQAIGEGNTPTVEDFGKTTAAYQPPPPGVTGKSPVKLGGNIGSLLKAKPVKEAMDTAIQDSVAKVPQAPQPKPEVVAAVKQELPVINPRVFSGTMTLAEFAKQLGENPAAGMQVAGEALVQKARTLDDIAAIARHIPGPDGTPLISNSVKRPFKTWKQVSDMVAKFDDPTYRRIFDRYGAEVPRDALEGGGFQVVLRSGGLDGSPPLTGVVDNTAKVKVQTPVIKSWNDPSIITKKLVTDEKGNVVSRANWRDELQESKEVAQQALAEELQKGNEANKARVERLKATIDEIDGHMHHPDVTSDTRALKYVQKTQLPGTHQGTSPPVVQATQEWLDKTVELTNDADNYHQLQLRQQGIQQSLEDQTARTMQLPDVGRRDYPLAEDNIVKYLTPKEVGSRRWKAARDASIAKAEAADSLANHINSQTMGMGTNNPALLDNILNPTSESVTQLPRGLTTPAPKLESNLEVARNEALSNTPRNAPPGVVTNDNGTFVEVKPNVRNPIDANAPMSDELRDAYHNAMQATLDVGDKTERKVLTKAIKELDKEDITFADGTNNFAAFTAQFGVQTEKMMNTFQRALMKELKKTDYDAIAHINPDGTTTVELLNPSRTIPINVEPQAPASPIEQAAARFNVDSTTLANHPENVNALVDHHESATQLLARMSQDHAEQLAEVEQKLTISTQESLDKFDELGKVASREREQRMLQELEDDNDKLDKIDEHLNKTSEDPCNL